jgi:hypothetical protein
MADEIHAAVNLAQASISEPQSNLVAADAAVEELPPGDHPVLPGREPGNHPIGTFIVGLSRHERSNPTLSSHAPLPGPYPLGTARRRAVDLPARTLGIIRRSRRLKNKRSPSG